jgi:predicted nucleic acid-binding protein
MVLIDTTILIDASRGNPVALSFLALHAEGLLASEVTRVELLQGARTTEIAHLDELMDLIDWVPIFEDVSRLAGSLGQTWLRSHSGIDVADLIIAATAQISGAEIATLNVKHFPMFPGLKPAY